MQRSPLLRHAPSLLQSALFAQSGLVAMQSVPESVHLPSVRQRVAARHPSWVATQWKPLEEQRPLSRQVAESRQSAVDCAMHMDPVLTHCPVSLQALL